MSRKAKSRRISELARNPEGINVTVNGDPNRDTAAARKVQGSLIPAGVYARAVTRSMGDVFGGDPERYYESAVIHAADMIERMAPRDPLEEMLVAQAAFAHARAMHLTRVATQQQDLAALRTTHEYADKASNTFRRLMLALAEYRRPPRVGAGHTSIRQANIAQQQVIQNHEHGSGTATNEQGCEPGSGEAPAALPALGGGAGVPPGVDQAREAVGPIDRPADG